MTTPARVDSEAKTAFKFTQQAEKLGLLRPSQETEATGSTQAVEAKFITSQDPVIVTADGARLPSVPLHEALELNRLRAAVEHHDETHVVQPDVDFATRPGKDGTVHGVSSSAIGGEHHDGLLHVPLSKSIAQSKTNPLFPPCAVYGPPSLLRDLQCLVFRTSSAILSLCFLLVIILGSFATSIKPVAHNLKLRLQGKSPTKLRKFYDEEVRRAEERKRQEADWAAHRSSGKPEDGDEMGSHCNHCSDHEEEFVPTEGGPDRLICDVPYYARRVGLDCELFEVQTEDGFILDLFHLYNPKTDSPTLASDRGPKAPEAFRDIPTSLPPDLQDAKYPVLLIHGLLQSAGAYCCNDDASLAFYLAKRGLDVWLGNNRCGFSPRHTLLTYGDPRMWTWNIRQMGVLDLPAFVTRILHHTGFPKLALVAHSQGTTQTLVALAKEQRPELGEYLSIACLLAPAAYAGPLIGKAYFKFMRVISPALFRVVFGLHAFIPFMMTMHHVLPGRFYGWMGYRVFSFLFNWTDARWDRGLRDRAFQFSPVYVSTECMRWWLGRECFATQKCILATREEGCIEDKEDSDEDSNTTTTTSSDAADDVVQKGRFAWYDARAPPMALWIADSDALVDGARLLRRFQRGREPFVNLLHHKTIAGYEHLDVLWAVDAMEQVGAEVLECIWRTVPPGVREQCRVPRGCESIGYFKDGGRG